MQCRVESCSSPAVYKTQELCRKHYLKDYKNRPFENEKTLMEQFPIENGKKVCRTCKQKKSIDEFYVHRKFPKVRYFHDCKKCMKIDRDKYK